MPLSGGFEDYPFIERTRRVRQNPIASYGVAALAVIVATLVRLARISHVIECIGAANQRLVIVVQ
jgi:hypothetical protein